MASSVPGGGPVQESKRSPRPAPAARRRAFVRSLFPEIDGGRYPAKAIVGDPFVVTATVFADGHVRLAAELLWQREGSADLQRVPMTPLGNDRWEGRFVPAAAGTYHYTVRARIDPYAGWAADLERRVAAGQDVSVDLEIGAGVVDREARSGTAGASPALTDLARSLRAGGAAAVARALDPRSGAAAAAAADWSDATEHQPLLACYAEPARAAFSAWYELFPRSLGTGRASGTLRDAAAAVPEIAAAGFDVLYLPPIHPIGRTARKGPNNAESAGADDPGSPWAIGSADGGHTAVDPALGSVADVRYLAEVARAHGMELALDIAFQCSPDHPYVREHPEWFTHRPDGTIQYAENPPKRYQDIYPFDFDTAAWAELWVELTRVVLFWVEAGVRVFRIDNPHTKPIRFWEWLIDQVRRAAPDATFLSEAFTRPAVMYELAKAGFSQSYTYFAWRNTPAELEEYVTELADPRIRQLFRPSLWPNTPDILTAYLQTGGRPAFAVRAVLAATLASSYGVYGPAFEHLESRAVAAGSEEYLHSEKYELRHRAHGVPPLRPLLAALNRIRRAHPALQRDRGVAFHPAEGGGLLAYSRADGDGTDVVLVVANTDPRRVGEGLVNVQTDRIGIPAGAAFIVTDLLDGRRYEWRAGRNYVRLDPAVAPAHIFAVSRR
ncbi:MAG TPA: alpha-1,4-glucan--maltose-1-phosphate maltosyltransferase [Candidatus Limnocylindria bacterium]|jgi:starch synthase (maltosyl-transferring)